MPDYVEIDRTEEQLLHAIDFADGKEKSDLTHAINITDGVVKAELTHAIEAGAEIHFITSNVTVSNVESGISIIVPPARVTYRQRIVYDSNGSVITTYVDTVVDEGVIIKTARGVFVGDRYLYAVSGETNTYDMYKFSKLQPKLVAGSNVTFSRNQDGTVRISATGGGGGGTSDYADLSNKPQINSVTLSGNKSLSDLGIAPAFTAGNGLTLANNILNALTNAQFVDTLPSANINEEATYYIMDSKVFPDVSGYDTTGDFPVIFVAYNEEAVQNKWVMLRTDFTNFFHWYYKTLEGNNYEVYGLNANQDGWTLLESDTGTGWANYLGVSNGQQQLFMSRIWYANQHLSGGELDYYPANNKANVYGVPTDTSELNPFIQIGYQRKENEWINLGRSDFTKLFEGLINTSAIKQTTGQSTSDLMSQKAVTDELSGKQNTLVNQSNIKSINGTSLLGSGDISIPVPLIFSNLSVATTDWVADSTYTDYGYKAVLTCSGVTASMEADVYLNGASASLGVVASFCDEGTDSVTIYSTSNENAITIDKVVAS